MTSNFVYGKLNERFDARAKVLREKGYKYGPIPGMNIAVFTKTHWGHNHTIAAATVLNACHYVWNDTLKTLI